ncbi:hypothetical protein BT96DRAFT_581747 [Gymnopus androsaceus JB14]|uniref:non-specific serine/threonine protein kinase n=1 Tax=Gymnopus androsaceus JB14 TaxID=1447944 RepID=A0A6A4IEU6_9AGAR|nr:hypothetical protein BT96DRAFT_581747 [Gymnopus androsaceus JB14]
MDASQALAYQQNKGTLVPGQSISVNKYTVQVERYLSQGGFAHVYLVRTATPVYNTTHHVLKRIAVANEAMLTDVKKEVDIMRLLKGHPNIVHLIDAAWHRMSNGLYEVFILMEFCPGGGIIDMMNRRLRERLTEAEILQIFVDVCEGVAYMHNSRPPLLHRDLKVENILQASPTSFKLCDFGSATTVATRPPSNMQEIRAVEEDLNRHTTLQYRAPEMIDAHLRRPIDEKSDVWALGVLLYKLCYYTTPFEEHGPLAILNVQYRIPPYPVYSSQLNALIGSMLREHGTQRPSVFELLVQVHRLRGTKSQFQYNIPPPQPLAPRVLPPQHKSPSPNPVQSTISYRQGPAVAASLNGANGNAPMAPSSLSKNAGAQARDKVLEAIAPMRREPPKEKNWLEDEEKAWQAVTAKSSRPEKPHEDAWTVSADRVVAKTGQRGFGDDFGEQLWKSTSPNSQSIAAANVMKPAISPSSGLKAPGRPLLTHQMSDQKIKPAVRGQEKDAFDGLGFNLSDTPAPTLAEARKFRTGLAYSNAKYGLSSPTPRPSPSPRPSYSSPSPSGQQSLGLAPSALNPNVSGSSWSSQPPGSSRPSSSHRQSAETLAAESKFPSLEELDAAFTPGHDRQRSVNSVKPVPHAPSDPQLLTKPPTSADPSRPDPSSTLRSPVSDVRLEQVSGFAMRAPAVDASKATKTPNSPASISRGPSVRKHRSSLTMKTPQDRNDGFYSSITSPSPQVPSSSGISPRLPPRPSQQRDWLTGDEDLPEISTSAIPTVETSRPVLRDSPSKRASYIEKSHIPIQAAIAVTHGSIPSDPAQVPESPSRRAHRVFPDLLENTAEPERAEPLTRNWSPVNASTPQDHKESESTSSADEEGPEDFTRSTGPALETKKRRKGRQSSVHDLVDLWGGAGRASPEKKREPQKETIRSTVTPLPKTDSLARRRSLATPAIPTNTRRKSISPQPKPSPNSSRPLASPHSNVTSPTSATSSRSRPQSMFIFPSKSSDGSAPPSAGLSPPENPQPRTTRRTSITDMVQRYETIDAVARTGVAPVSRSVSQKVPTENNSAPSPSKRDGQTNGRFPSAEDAHSPVKRRSISSGIPRPSPSKYSSASSEELPEMPTPRSRKVLSEEPQELPTPRARRISTKPEPTFPPSRKLTLPEESARSGDIRSPIP